MSGQDLGKVVEDIVGKYEYEYYFISNRGNNKRLFALLGHKGQKGKVFFI